MRRLLVAVVAVLWTSIVSAQTGGFRGTVVDAQGRVIPGASVVVTGASPSIERTTDERGGFSIPSLAPGDYQVRVALSGFLDEVRDLRVPAGGIDVTVVLRPSYAETVIVTATRTEQTLLSVPTTVTVIPSAEIRTRAADDFGDLLAGTAGLNLARLSARDISFDFRTAGGVLSNALLVLVDGRSVNQDGLGNVFWDLLPIDVEDVEQVELIGTPGSAVWGANALSGVINLRTRAIRTDPGGMATVGIGSVGTRLAKLRWSESRGRLSYRVGASYYEQDAWERDTTLPDGSPLPTTAVFDNAGTTQTKLNLRADWEASAGRVWTTTLGFADTSGIVHSSSGPNAWADKGSYALSGSVGYRTDPVEAQVYWHRLRGDTTSSLFGNTFFATTDVLSADVVARRAAGARQGLIFGGSLRASFYDLTLAPGDSFRSSGGVFVEDQIALSSRLTWSAGGRVDKFDSFGAQFSPRTSVMFRPTSSQAVRVAFNRAFRAPSLLESFADAVFVNRIPLIPGLPPIVFATEVAGNRDLRPEVMHAVEAGYTRRLGARASASVTVYRNSVRDNVRFSQVASYGPTDPPEGWFLPLEFVPALPKTMSFLNIGTIRDRGVEVTSHADWGRGLSSRLAYSWQDKTTAIKNDVTFPLQLNRPPRHQGSVRMIYNGPRWRGSIGAAYTGAAFWSDVLDSRFWGTTKSYALVDAKAVVPVVRGRVDLAVSAVNLLDKGSSNTCSATSCGGK